MDSGKICSYCQYFLILPAGGGTWQLLRGTTRANDLKS